MASPLRNRLGEALRAQRKHWELTQDSLAFRVGLTPRYIAGLERGERNITLDTLDELARILGVDPVALLNGEFRYQLPEKRDAPVDANPVKRKRAQRSTLAQTYEDGVDATPSRDLD